MFGLSGFAWSSCPSPGPLPTNFSSFSCWIWDSAFANCSFNLTISSSAERGAFSRCSTCGEGGTRGDAGAGFPLVGNKSSSSRILMSTSPGA